MTPKGPANPELLEKFSHWWMESQSNRWACLWRRRPVWIAQAIQKLGFHQVVTARLFWGDRMRVMTGETVSGQILAFGYTEASLTALMLWLLRTGQTFVDVGTHVGYIALLGCRLVGPRGHGICFEPSPTACELARKNLSRFVQIDLHPQAVADSPGFRRFRSRPLRESAMNSFCTEGDQSSSIEVPVTTLDVALASRTRRIDFLKCDVEGYEMAVLKGAHRLLSTDAPLLVLEAGMPTDAGQHPKRADELSDHLKGYGYEAFDFDFDGRLRVGPLGHLPVHHANVGFVPLAKRNLLRDFV
jgi:FkbM family methyltransferase